MKKITKDDILKKAMAKKNRMKVTFSLDPDCYERFQKECEKAKAPMSRVLEAFMNDFVKGDN